MIAKDCLFCKIIEKKIPAKIIAEDDNVIVIQDIVPKAPTHYLIIPKKHIENVRMLEETDAYIVSSMMLMAKKLSNMVSGNGSFRIIINNGAEVGQTVFHLHLHFLAGKKLTDF